jgi:hypothetical protein
MQTGASRVAADAHLASDRVNFGDQALARNQTALATSGRAGRPLAHFCPRLTVRPTNFT